jgi:hypothetical protein
MTDKFDPNATPISHSNMEEAHLVETGLLVVALDVAETLERRAALAEEKLKIVYEEIEKALDSPREKSVQTLWLDIARRYKTGGLP